MSVVIAAWSLDRLEPLVRCARAALAQSPPPREVIVVVDGNEELLTRAREDLPNVRVIVNAESRGLSGARNTGVAIARGEIVAFLDDDAVPDDDWLPRLIAPYDEEHVVGTGGMVRPQWVTGGGPPPWLPEEFYWTVGCSYRGIAERELRNPIGANMSFRRDAVVRCGGFRTGLGRVRKRPLGCEETELALRLTREDPRRLIIHTPAAGVAHEVAAERARWRYFSARCWAEGLSKATMAAATGPSRGLSSERRYVCRTLPRALAREAAHALRGDAHALARAAAICAGLAITVTGYLHGRLTQPTATGRAG